MYLTEWLSLVVRLGCHLPAHRRMSCCRSTLLAWTVQHWYSCQGACSPAAGPRPQLTLLQPVIDALTHRPSQPQAHLKKLFAGIHRVRFSGDAATITAMLSMDSEQVDLTSAVAVSESVEAWLVLLNTAMKATLLQQLAGLFKLQEQEAFQQSSSQVLGLKHALTFTEAAEKAIMGNSLPTLQKQLSGELMALSRADYTGHHMLQLKKQALVMDYIHYLDVVDYLITSRPAALTDWAWSRQLRYYKQEVGPRRDRILRLNFLHAVLRFSC